MHVVRSHPKLVQCARPAEMRYHYLLGVKRCLSSARSVRPWPVIAISRARFRGRDCDVRILKVAILVSPVFNNSGALDAGEMGAVPAEASFEVADPPFGSGWLFDLVAECSLVLVLVAGRDESLTELAAANVPMLQSDHLSRRSGCATAGPLSGPNPC